MWCRRLTENTGCKKLPKNRHLDTIAQVCWAVSSQLRQVSTIGKKLVIQQYLFHMPSQYGELRPTNDWDLLASLGNPSRFQRVSCFGFVTVATSLNRSQPNFARCLAVSWTGALYVHFRGLLPVTEFCYVQNSLCVQVLRFPVLAALLHGSRAVGVRQTLWLWAEGATYLAGRPSRWALADILVVKVMIMLLLLVVVCSCASVCLLFLETVEHSQSFLWWIAPSDWYVPYCQLFHQCEVQVCYLWRILFKFIQSTRVTGKNL